MQDYEVSALQENQNRIAMSDALMRLQQNNDFKMLFSNHLLNALPLALIKMMTGNAERDISIVSKLTSIGYVQQFMDEIVSEGAKAKVALNELMQSNNEG